MRWPVVPLLAAVLTATVAGCHAPRTDLIEAELRVKDADLRELRAELEKSHAYNEYLQREVKLFQHAFAGAPVVAGPSVTATVSAGARVTSLTLGRQTGGFEEDGIPGEEALQVVIEPRDADGHVLKVPGTAQVHALEVTREGVKRPLSSWEIPADQLRRSWRDGLFSTGYFLVLPWKNWPTTERMRVVVQFVSADNRLFEGDRDFTLRVSPPSVRQAPPPTGPEPLPPPRKLEPDPEPPGEAKPSPDDLPLPEPAASRPLRGAVEILRPVVHRESP